MIEHKVLYHLIQILITLNWQIDVGVLLQVLLLDARCLCWFDSGWPLLIKLVLNIDQLLDLVNLESVALSPILQLIDLVFALEKEPQLVPILLLHLLRVLNPELSYIFQ